MLQKLKQAFSVDLRALALLRIGVALVIILDLSLRLCDLTLHYTDQGLLPISALLEHAWNPFHFSIYNIGGSKGIVLGIFLLNYFFAISLLLGYKTRISTIFCWLLMISLHNRNPMILQAGDDLLRLLLFWGIFMPWGKRYATDAEIKTEEEAGEKYFSPVVIAYILQIASIYFFTALFKTGAEWTSDGTALYYALSLDQMVYPFGKLLYPHKDLLKVMTFGVYYMELLAPFLLVIPFFVSRLRWIFIIIIVIFQLGIGLSMNVGLFFILDRFASIGCHGLAG